ncbi:WD40 repeat-like protein [Mycoemilia scoparia]|uniref:WD40 repeat-like protein n=1 Tax=Mycoemilia scoparia TaxID=417184 RepID=A0A9W7ZPZ5_9FUNG|nr:WD40 repeat-like protein [Mycoemilia scoparia]
MSFKQTSYLPPLPTTERGYPTRLTYSNSRDGDYIAYPNGKNIIDDSDSYEYTGHTVQTTVARISPSGFYGASGDKHGNIHIWDTQGEEHKQIYKYKFLAGAVKDLDWDSDSKRIVVVGEGTSGNAHVFMFDSGNSVGSILGHSKTINACSFRKSRPFRIVTGGEDYQTIIHEGPPFKIGTDMTLHQSFVNDVRYSPSGDQFVTVGADKVIILYEGKTGEKIRQIGNGDDVLHTGAINGVAWSPDGKQVATASSDQTVKVWDTESGKLVRNINCYGSSRDIKHHQVGIVWTNSNDIVSLSLSGAINIIGKDADSPTKILGGIQKGIVASVHDRERKVLYTASYDGRIRAWDFGNGISAAKPSSIGDDTYTTGITSVTKAPEGFSRSQILFGAFDDKVHFVDVPITDPSSASFTSNQVGVEGTPSSLAVIPGPNTGGDEFHTLARLQNSKAVIISDKGTTVIEQDNVTAIGSTIASPEASPAIIAIGFEDGAVKLYTVDGDGSATPTGISVTPGQRAISALSFTPNREYLAVGDASGKIFLVKTSDGDIVTSRWVFHSARVQSLNWSPDGVHLASSSLDCHVAIWDRQNFGKSIRIRHAHTEGVGYVDFLNENEIISVGQDSGIKAWHVTF